MSDFFKLRKEKGYGYIAFNSQNRQYHYFKTNTQPTPTEILKAFCLIKEEYEILPKIIYCENTQPTNPNLILSAPLISYLEISNSCILNCKHCFKSHIKYSHTMNTEKILLLIDDLEQMGCFELRFVGFDAVYNDDFPEILKYAKEKNFYLILDTCAYFTPDKMKFITDLEFNEILVSLDGDREIHDRIRISGSYDKVINLLEYLSVHDVKTRINMTVSNNNIDKMQYIADLSLKYKASVAYTPMRQIGNGNKIKNELTSKEMYQIASKVNNLRKQYPEHRFMLAYHDFAGDITQLHHPIWEEDVCPATKNVSILNDGRVFFCDFLEYIGDKYCGGNILEENINNIWQFSDAFQQYRDLKKVSKCYSCNYYQNYKCMGGCASEILGDYDIFYDKLCFVKPEQLQFEEELSVNKYQNIYNERYYIHGKMYGISNYENYSYKQEKITVEVSDIIKLLGISRDNVIVDYGCALGYYVRVFRNMNYNTYGIDVSEYAIQRAKEDKTIAEYVCQSENLFSLGLETIDCVIAKDTLEHLTINKLITFLESVKQYNSKLFAAIPLTKFDGGRYICDNVGDKSHIMRRTERWWMDVFKHYLKTDVTRVYMQNFHLLHTNKDKGMGYFLINNK